MGNFKNDPVCRLCNEKEKTASHILCDYEALTCWTYTTLGYSDTKKKLPKGNLVKLLLNLVEGRKLFAQE
jgi:hypothetical protein